MPKSRPLISLALLLCGLAFTSAPAGAETGGLAAGNTPHKVVFQVTEGDPKKWNMVLINAANVLAELGKENVAMDIVVYGPAIEMLRMESEVGPRVDEVIANGVNVVACERTMRGQHISAEDMLPAIQYTRTGVVYLMERQEQGYSYIRP